MDKPSEGKSPGHEKLIAFDKFGLPSPDDELEDTSYSYEGKYLTPPTEKEVQKTMACKFVCCKSSATLSLDNMELTESFLNHPPLEAMQNLIIIVNIQQHQFQDLALNQCRCQDPQQFSVKFIKNRPLICWYQDPNEAEGLWKIALPDSLIRPAIVVFIEYDTIRAHFKATGLYKACEEFFCTDWQCNKHIGVGYGKLPPRDAALLPWSEVATDLIGPWTIKINNEEIEFNALTCIDTVTNLMEMIRINNKTAAHVAQQFENCWIS
eukprot:8137399-Ditylum_brightwellii.AAC.2